MKCPAVLPDPVGSAIDLEALGRASELMAARRSIRRYRTEAVPGALVDELLGCAINAPSAHNRQPWRFVVLQDREPKARLATAMGNRLRQDRLRDGDAPAVIEADAARSYERITGAPVVIVVAVTMADMDVYRDASRSDAEYLMAVQSTAMAVQNLLLAAHAAGLGACWMCAPLFCPETVKTALELPATWHPQAIVTLGYPAAPGKPYSRRPLADVVRHARSPRS
jgi:F420 biosynthesis protein FbiB-like protein